MLQRKQTIFMLASVVAVMMMLVLKNGLCLYSCGEESPLTLTGMGMVGMLGDGVLVNEMRYGLSILLVLMLLLPLVGIFMYKRRKLQVRMMLYAMILNVLFFAYMFFYELPACESMAADLFAANGIAGEVVRTYQPVNLFVMPVVSLVACFFAMRGVLYDIALLASADRLRSYRPRK